MGIFSVFLFCLLVGTVISEEPYVGDSGHDSLVPVTIFVTAEQYQACKEYGDCTFTPQSVSLNESGEKLEGKSYFEICRKIHIKMEKLEAEHPEVKYLKLKLMQMFDSHSSEFDLEYEKGEFVGMKILDFVKNLIEKLKVELQDKLHKPEQIPIVETTSEEEITAEPEHGHPMQVGSIRGIPGIHFPNYTEIPITSFSCSDKTLIPGFYADLETGCQVFHLCYEHRRESFLCPIGTIFNQPILACDYWYSANCSLAPIYYEEPNVPEPENIPIVIEEIVKNPKKDYVSTDFLKFLPVKANVAEIPKFDKPITTPKSKPVTFDDTEVIADKIFDGILSLGSKAISKTSDMLHKIPDPEYKSFPFEGKLASKAFSTFSKAKKVTSAAKLTAAATKIASVAAFTSGKAKVASLAAVPLVKAKVASAAAIPIVKAKVASAAAIPIVKAKVASAAAIPIVKAKVASAAAIPIVKAKVASAAAVPIVKAKVASAAAVPIVKAKVASAAAIPMIKAKAALPMIKTKVAAAAIPLLKADAALIKKIPIVKGKLFTLPLAKTKLGAAAIPAFKAKKATMAVPYLKVAALKPKFLVAPLKVKSAIALPMMKTKLAKAAISPLTKKALALGYLKLLKAKKIALMG